MSVLSQVAWTVPVALVIVAVGLVAWLGHDYYGQPSNGPVKRQPLEPTLLDAPLLAEQQRAADADPVSPKGGAR